jgi:RecB family endonuclease NucS
MSARRIIGLRHEQQLENLLSLYPDLIEPNLGRLQRQKHLSPGSKVDLIFDNEKIITVVELKRGAFDLSALQQLLRYLRILARRGKKVRGIGIGSHLETDAAKAIAKAPFSLSFKALDQDVPVSILVCLACRHVRGHRVLRCPQCQDTRVIR